MEYFDTLEEEDACALLGFITGVQKEPPWGLSQRIVLKFIPLEQSIRSAEEEEEDVNEEACPQAKKPKLRLLPESLACFSTLFLPQVFEDNQEGKLLFFKRMRKAVELEGVGFSLEGESDLDD